MRPKRIQRTFYIDGVRVLVTWNDRNIGRVKVTDPGGDYAKEQRVLAAVAGGMATVFVDEGIGLNIGAPRIIPDHGEPA